MPLSMGENPRKGEHFPLSFLLFFLSPSLFSLIAVASQPLSSLSLANPRGQPPLLPLPLFFFDAWPIVWGGHDPLSWPALGATPTTQAHLFLARTPPPFGPPGPLSLLPSPGPTPSSPSTHPNPSLEDTRAREKISPARGDDACAPRLPLGASTPSLAS
jgi:hypothetical protein